MADSAVEEASLFHSGMRTKRHVLGSKPATAANAPCDSTSSRT
jgi:hypothetical protein